MRFNGIGFATDEAISIGHARFGTEVVHFVVEQKACATHNNARAKTKVDGVGHRNGLACFVYDRIVCGLVAFII